MWNSIPLMIAAEYIRFGAGNEIYVSATCAKDRAVNLAFCALIGSLAILSPASQFGPPPTSVQALAWSALAMWLTVPWAAWADRHRLRVPDKRETLSD